VRFINGKTLAGFRLEEFRELIKQGNKMANKSAWSKAKSSAGAANMGTPIQRRARKAPSGCHTGGTKKMKGGKY